MKEELIQQIDALDSELQALVAQLQSYSHQQLNQQPAPNSWSATQIMHHLMLSEKYAVLYCEKKLSHKPTLKTVGPIDRLKEKMIKWYLQVPIKIKAPTKLNESQLPKESNLADILNQWQEQRKVLRLFFEELPAEYVDKVIYKHPFGGRLSLKGMLNFFEAHFDRHRKQLMRALIT